MGKVNTSVATSLVRPTLIEIVVVSNVPCFNQVVFIVDFLNCGWGAKGNSGLVIETNASENSIEKRVEW
jgi:hypothetical protein